MRALLCGLCMLVAGSASAAHPAGPAPASLALVHVNVVDVDRGRVLPDRTVVIGNGRILSVRPGRKTAPRISHLIDGRGKYLIPGLWDMHVHLFRHNPRAQNDGSWFPLFVANGVTGVRDMFENFDDLPIMARWRRELEAGRIGPRIVAAGALIDGHPANWKGSLEASDAEEARQLVREARRRGADFIKPYDGLTPALFTALAEETRRSGLGFAGHVPFSMRALDTAKVGLQSIEHMGLLDRDCSGSNRSIAEWEALLGQKGGAFNRAIIAEYSPGKCRQIAKQLARSGSWVEIDFVERLQRADQRWRSRDLLRFINPAIRADWPDVRPPDVEQRLLAKERVKAQVAQTLLAAHVPLFAGTDVGNEYLVPGFSLHDTLELLVLEAGFAPADALRAATISPARFLGLDRVQGSIAAGRNADLVLLSANPLADIRNSRKINAMILRGRLLDRARLDALLAQAEAEAVKEGVNKDEAEKIRKQIEEAGGTVELK